MILETSGFFEALGLLLRFYRKYRVILTHIKVYHQMISVTKYENGIVSGRDY